MSERDLREQLYNSFKHRALLYYLIFDELRSEIGEQKATEVLERAIRRRGQQIGKQFAVHGPDDLEGLRDAFLDIIPDQGHMFSPEVMRCDQDCLEITLRTCPLKDAWQEAGLDESEVATLCRIAAAIDLGTFEAAGFAFAAETWRPGRDGCCHLQIRPGKT
jgi:predicted ArsR family transcriptional regulator